jgi:hypothetical protein
MCRTRFPRSMILITVITLFVAGIGANLWAAEPEEAPPAQTGTRTVESGPSLSSMERASGSTGWSYNSEYIFGISKAVRDSSMPPGAKIPVYVFALPLDLCLLPFEALAGLLGE